MRVIHFIELLFVVFSHTATIARAANILSLVEADAADQQVWYNALFKGLINRHHKLTVVSGCQMDFKSNHLTHIHLEAVTSATLSATQPVQVFTDSWLGPFERVYRWYSKQMSTCKGIVSSHGLVQLIALSRRFAQEHAFDLILYDVTYGPSCLLALAQLFAEVPIVGVSASNITPDLLKAARGARVQPATVPHFATAHGERMNFVQRWHNAIVYAAADFFRQFAVSHVKAAMLAENQALHEAGISAGFENMVGRIEVVLVNSHPAIDFVHSLPPNVIEVGGLQFDDINRPLAVEIQTFIDNAKDGVFVITLGGAGNESGLTTELIGIVQSVVESFPEYGFIWAAAKGELPATTPKNLFVGRWLRQSNILAQRKMKALICFGGHMDIQEAVYGGVPVIAMPQSVHQPSLAVRVQALGFGIFLDDLGLNGAKLRNAIDTLILESKYTDNAKRRQAAFRIRPRAPLDEALWWIEHTLAHPIEAGYLHSQAASEIGFFAVHTIDVVMVALFVAIMFLANCFMAWKKLSPKVREDPPQRYVDQRTALSDENNEKEAIDITKTEISKKVENNKKEKLINKKKANPPTFITISKIAKKGTKRPNAPNTVDAPKTTADKTKQTKNKYHKHRKISISNEKMNNKNSENKSKKLSKTSGNTKNSQIGKN